MKPLSDAVPIDQFTSLFQNVREEVVATDIKSLMVGRPKDIGGVGMFIWDELVHRGLVSDPFKIAPIVNNEYSREWCERNGANPLPESRLGGS